MPKWLNQGKRVIQSYRPYSKIGFDFVIYSCYILQEFSSFSFFNYIVQTQLV